MSETIRNVAVVDAPKAIGPYAQGVIAGGFLFTAGQVPFDPGTMTIVEGDIAVQTARVFDNLSAVLAGGGCGLEDVVKATVYLADLGDFAEMNRVYAERFGDHRPARSTVQVAKLPAGARIEIDFIARVP
jgi:2-iminobutanoate/2-iminopropanoate deaminase